MKYDLGNREEAIDNKGPRELFKGFCLPYLSEMFIRGLNIHDSQTSVIMRSALSHLFTISYVIRSKNREFKI